MQDLCQIPKAVNQGEIESRWIWGKASTAIFRLPRKGGVEIKRAILGFLQHLSEKTGSVSPNIVSEPSQCFQV